jgi:hypothetical protein
MRKDGRATRASQDANADGSRTLWIAGIVLAIALPARGQIYFGISQK